MSVIYCDHTSRTVVIRRTAGHSREQSSIGLLCRQQKMGWGLATRRIALLTGQHGAIRDTGIARCVWGVGCAGSVGVGCGACGVKCGVQSGNG